MEASKDPWRCSNEFGLTLRGHWKDIPEESPILLSMLKEILKLPTDHPTFRSVLDRTNFNYMYDSYFAPCDFMLTCLTIRLPEQLPEGAKYKTEFIVNGVPVQKLSVLEQTSTNIITLDVECAYPIFEDDFIEVKVAITRPQQSVDFEAGEVKFPEHNIVYGVGGIVDYRFYKSMWIDEERAFIIDYISGEHIDLEDTIDRIGDNILKTDDIILLVRQDDPRENGIYLYTGNFLIRHEESLGINNPLEMEGKYVVPYLNNNSFWGITDITPDPRFVAEVERTYNSLMQNYKYQVRLWEMCQDGDTNACMILSEIQGLEEPVEPQEPNNPVISPVWGRDVTCWGKLEYECEEQFFKQNILLQNRSGNREITDRYYLDQVRSPVSFKLQSIRIMAFEDDLREADLFERPPSCFYIDLILNRKTLLPMLGLDALIPVDTVNNNIKIFDISFDNVSGVDIKRGDNIEMRVYQRNKNAKYNGKIIQCYLAGCSPLRFYEVYDMVGVYKPCTDQPCIPENPDPEQCEPPVPCLDPNVNVLTSGVAGSVMPIPSDREYVTLSGKYVLLNGEKIWLGN